MHRRELFVLVACLCVFPACVPQTNVQTALDALQQAQYATEAVWGVVPENIRQSEQTVRCEHWEGTGECPTLLDLINGSLTEARTLVSASTENSTLVSEIMHYAGDLIDLLKSHGVAIPDWVRLMFSLAFQVLALILPLLL